MDSVYLINYDNGSHIPVLPQNLLVLKEYLLRNGVPHVNIIDFNLTHQSYWKVLHDIPQGIIGLGFISGYWPHQEAIKIAEAIEYHPHRDKIKFIIGGHAPTAAPEYYRKKLEADAVFSGPAEKPLLEYVTKGQKNGYWNCNEIPKNALKGYYSHNIDIYKRIKFPNTKADEFAIQILSGRGCPYNCAFCAKTIKGYVPYPIKNIIDEIKFYVTYHGVRHFQFSDELLMVSEKKMNKIIDALLQFQDDLGIDLGFDCNGRLNIASSENGLELLKRMKTCGFRYINYGCEAMSNEVLNNINKQQTVEEIEEGVANTLEAGLSPGLNFMWGNEGDNASTLYDAVNFIENNTDYCELRTIRPVTPYPGSPLYLKLLETRRYTFTIDDFYKEHTNSDLFSFHFMDGFSVESANKTLGQANKVLVSNYYDYKKTKILSMIDEVYSNPDMEFRGFRDI